jgi:hypothetical protein
VVSDPACSSLRAGFLLSLAIRLGRDPAKTEFERWPSVTDHKFAIGQAVDFARGLQSISRPSGPYEVVSVLPTDGADSASYRVKSQAEPFSRAVRESDLVALATPTDLAAIAFAPPDEEAAPANWTDPIAGRRAPRPPRSR